MSRRIVRKSAAAPAVPAQPAPPPREHHYPAWYRPNEWRGSVQHSETSLSRIVEAIQAGEFRIPRFQRSFVWTDEQVIRLFESLLSGYHIGTMILWERWDLPESRESIGGIEVVSPTKSTVMLVVDGQQRLGSIAQAALSGRFWFDMQAGQLTTSGPGPWRVPAGYVLGRGHYHEMFDWYVAHADEHGLDREDVFDAWGATANVLDRIYVSAVRLGRRWTIDAVMESFRRLNTEGTRMDPAELEEALRRAAGSAS